MNLFLLITHGVSILLYLFIVWRYYRIHRAQESLFSTMNTDTYRARTHPVFFAVLYGFVTVGIALATTALVKFQPHLL